MRYFYILIFVMIACPAQVQASAAQVQEVSANGRVITLDGEPFFPIGVYSVRIEDMEEVAAAGFNLIHTYTRCCNEKDLQFQEEFLSAADALGLKVFLYPFYPQSQVDESGEKTAQLAQTVRARAGHPSLLFWYTFDEPELNKQSPELCRRVHDFIHETDAVHPTAVVLATGARYADYVDTSDWFMVDPYPIPFVAISLVRDAMRNAMAAAAGKPVLAVIQAHDQTPYFNLKLKDAAPTEKEIRNMAYQAVANGASGIIFWALHPGKYDLMGTPEQWGALKNVAADLHEHEDIFILPDAGVEIVPEPSDAPVDILVKKAGGGYWLLAVNYQRKGINVELDVSALNPVSATPLNSGEALGPDGRLTLVMESLGIRIIEITK